MNHPEPNPFPDLGSRDWWILVHSVQGAIMNLSRKVPKEDTHRYVQCLPDWEVLVAGVVYPPQAEPEMVEELTSEEGRRMLAERFLDRVKG